MISKAEKYYGSAFKFFLVLINPLKKLIIRTECKVHCFINKHSIQILSTNGYLEEYKFFLRYIDSINAGAIWADQDFKSTSHFYSPFKKRGLYGHDNAYNLTHKYYFTAVKLWHEEEYKKSMFFLGACVHILQDLTIPQHVNIRLLDNHRQYENFVKHTYNNIEEFKTDEPPIKFNKLNEYVNFNSKTALKIYKKYKHIKVSSNRYYKITFCSLPLAQRTTAGCLLMFLKDTGFYNN